MVTFYRQLWNWLQVRVTSSLDMLANTFMIFRIRDSLVMWGALSTSPLGMPQT